MSRPPRIPATRRRPLRVLVVLNPIPDDASVHEKNALAAQNACATEGRCPVCGATGEISEDDQYDNVFHLTFAHEPWCPVVSSEEAA